MEIKRTERGWIGHYICADRCKFRRNTLLEFENEKIVVSSVGLQTDSSTTGYCTIGAGRHFETMAFFADLDDTRYYDADTSRQIHFDSKWAIAEIDADDEANEMHEAVVAELSEKLRNGLRRSKYEDTL